MNEPCRKAEPAEFAKWILLECGFKPPKPKKATAPPKRQTKGQLKACVVKVKNDAQLQRLLNEINDRRKKALKLKRRRGRK